MMPLLATGKLDFGNGAPGASLYNAVMRGIEVRAVADASTDPPGYGWSKLLIRTDLVKSGRFKTIADLKGMTIVGAASASSSSPQVARLVAMAGLKYSDISREVLPYPQHPLAFQNGAIEASLTIEPFATLSVDRGIAVAIMGNDRFYPNQEVSCILSSADLIKDHRDVIVRYLRAFLKGVRFYEDGLAGGKIAGPNADAVIDVIARHTSLNPDLIRRTVPVSIDPNGHLNLASMRDDLAWYKGQDYVKGDIAVEAVVDTTLSPEALKTIGVYRRKV
jgi:NitT/TauT family transport system substrate-binding protein